jgi:hypothetical protein
MERAMTSDNAGRVREILATVKVLAVDYYGLTGKPLGVTGEVSEYVAATTLGLLLAPPRTPGYDATREVSGGTQRIQIKGRAFENSTKKSQKIGRIKRDAPCDIVLLVLLDNASLEAHSIWEAPFTSVLDRLNKPGSKARARGVLAVSEFKALATKVWPL